MEVETGRGGYVISSGTFILRMLSKRGTIYRPPAGIKVFRLESGKHKQQVPTVQYGSCLEKRTHPLFPVLGKRNRTRINWKDFSCCWPPDNYAVLKKKRFFCLDRELTMICPRKKNPRSVRQQRRTDGSLNLGGSKPVFAQKSVTKKGNKLEKQGRMRRALHDSVALYSSLHFFAKRLFRKQVVIIFSSPLVCQKEKRNVMWWPWLGLQRWNMGEERRVLKCNSKNRTCNTHHIHFPQKKKEACM